LQGNSFLFKKKAFERSETGILRGEEREVAKSVRENI
jgi:hypothetical protein